MAVDLAKHLTRDIREDEALCLVPDPIIEAVLRVGLARLALIVPAECDASEIDAIDFETCESCCNLIDPKAPLGAVMDSDGIWVCDACREDGGPAVPSPDTGGSDR